MLHFLRCLLVPIKIQAYKCVETCVETCVEEYVECER